MSRQDANAAFALTSFLYGGNAAYIDDLYARYEADPQGGRRRVAGVLRQPEGRRRAMSPKNARGPSWQRPDWPPLPRGDLIAALDGDWAEAGKAAGDKVKAQAQARGVELSAAGGRARHPRFDPRADADPRLSGARAFSRQSRSARPRAAEERGGTRSAQLRLRRGRSRPADLPRQGAGARIRHGPRNRRHPAAHLLPDARRRVPAHLRRRAEGLDSGAHRGARQGDHLHPRRQARHPQQAGRGRGLREILRPEIHRHQALRPRRRRSR